MTTRLDASLANEQTRLGLSALLRGIRAAVERRTVRTAALAAGEFTRLAITERHVSGVLDDAESLATDGRPYGPGAAFDQAETEALARLARHADAAGVLLPRQALIGRGLDDLDQQILLLAAAPLIDPSFGTLYGYLHDSLNASAATAYVAIEVLATGCDAERLVREACGPFGLLRADGWLTSAAAGRDATALEPVEGVVELFSGSTVDCALIGTAHLPPPTGRAAGGADASTLRALAGAFADGRVDVVGVWGSAGDTEPIIAAVTDGRAHFDTGPAGLTTALQRAAIAGASCVLRFDELPEQVGAVLDALALSTVPVVLTGPEPIAGAYLGARRRYAEVELPACGFAERRDLWAGHFPVLTRDRIEDLAARFRLQPHQIAAVAAMARSAQSWTPAAVRPSLDTLANRVARQRAARLATIRHPERGPDMLVLPATEYAQVMNVAVAARAWPVAADSWRLDRFGNPGVTALFAGDPGTGKTLAAEAIAVEVGVDLMAVDVSRLTSKWVGETEKNLDTVFDEAAASSCVLFFDEADSLFGQRGEVTRGADRYANLEVGYLLQRLERYDGVVILASNLRANLDAAFTRRFHHVVHFPRPAPPERRRLWELALGPPITLAGPVDLAPLAALELTGAAIAAVVRSAALAAYAAGRRELGYSDLAIAIRAQFQREGRLSPADLPLAAAEPST